MQSTLQYAETGQEHTQLGPHIWPTKTKTNTILTLSRYALEKTEYPGQDKSRVLRTNTIKHVIQNLKNINSVAKKLTRRQTNHEANVYPNLIIGHIRCWNKTETAH